VPARVDLPRPCLGVGVDDERVDLPFPLDGGAAAVVLMRAGRSSSTELPPRSAVASGIRTPNLRVRGDYRHRSGPQQPDEELLQNINRTCGRTQQSGLDSSRCASRSTTSDRRPSLGTAGDPASGSSASAAAGRVAAGCCFSASWPSSSDHA
jgi:hypothetical protein